MIIKNIYSDLYKKVYWKIILPISNVVFKYFPVDNNKVLFDNFAGMGFGDNPRYIAEELNRVKPDARQVWIVQNKSNYNFPAYIKPVKLESVRSIYERATSKVWVDNVRNIYPTKKKTNQYYLQTWHGPDSGKMVERDAEDKLDVNYCMTAKKAGSETDAIISNSENMDRLYKRAFWLNSSTEILKIGLPKFDPLFKYGKDQEIIKWIKLKYNIDLSSKVVLYAPTFRDDFSTDVYICEYFRDIIKTFEKKLNSKIILIVRMHPNAITHSNFITYGDGIIDGSQISSFQELSLISDYLITDYSSTFFDFLLLGKPVFLCVTDIDKYERERGLRKEYYEFPFIFTKSIEELLEEIRKFEMDKYIVSVKKYLENNPIYDTGNASALAVHWIVTKLHSKENSKCIVV